MNSPQSPSPTHILRSHSTPLATLSISDDNERIYSGDASGLVVVTSTRSLRAITSWKAHTDGLLGVQEWGQHVITFAGILINHNFNAHSICSHGRDNKLHVWTRIDEQDLSIGGSASLPGLPTPMLCYSLDVNALNYCRFSLMPITYESSKKALVCIPNLVESSLVGLPFILDSRTQCQLCFI